MGGRGSASKLRGGGGGGGGVPGVAGGSTGGTGVDGSGRMGGSAGGNPMHVEPGPSGRDSKDQRGLQETNGMAGGTQRPSDTAREHIDGWDLDDEQKVKQVMLDTGWSRERAQAMCDAVSDFSDGNADFGASSDAGSYMYGAMAEESQLISAGIMSMPYYDGILYRGITVDNGVAEGFFDEMRSGDVFGFAGHYTGDKLADSFSYWSPGDLRDAGVVTSFTSDFLVAADYGGLKVGSNNQVIGVKDSRANNGYNKTLIFRMEGNKTASSITHLAVAGADESEVLSPIWQQFEYGGRTLIKTLPNGHEVWQITIKDKGIKPKDTGPVR